MLTEGHGLPISLAVAGANAHDKTLVEETLANQSFHPQPEQVVLQRICMDKGYDSADVRQAVIACGYEPHVLSRGEEKANIKRNPRYRARRWVCERTHSWMNRFRRILIRWEKKAANYEAMLHIACAYICYSAAGVLG